MRMLIASCAVFLLAGCSHFKENMNSLIGQPADIAITQFGPPEAEYPLSDGGRVLQWSRSSSMQMPGYSYTTPQTTYSQGTVSAYGSGGYASGTYNGSSTTYVQRTTPGYNLNLNCSFRLTVGSDNLIQAWAAQGNDC